MIYTIRYFSLLLCFILLSSCKDKLYDEAVILHNSKVVPNESTSTNKGLDPDYWYAGKAEITKYDLSQNRYRDIHNGEIVLIFVTEDFLTDKQVKNDNYVNKNSTPILKTNQLRRFTTGLYDYSMMTSVFTRSDGSKTEKITMGSQDWCGHSFVQVNNKKDRYDIQIRSYFESEGDQDFSVKADLLEDEFFNLIRIDPSLINEGTFKILPSLNYLRLTHRKMEALPATIKKSNLSAGSTTLEISYPSINRTVTIVYESAAPYKILSFEEAYPSMFDKQERSSKAIKNREIHSAYWKLNKATDKVRREELSITGFE